MDIYSEHFPVLRFIGVKDEKGMSLWHGSKGQSPNRSILMVSILNLFLCYPKPNLSPQCHTKPFISYLFLHLPAPGSLNLLRSSKALGNFVPFCFVFLV